MLSALLLITKAFQQQQYRKMKKNIEKDKIAIIKECLVIVDKLGSLDIEDIDDIENLITKSKKIKKSRHWKL